MNYPRRFIFRGNASGVSAHIRRPEDRILPVQAASSLPVTGGISESKAGPQSLGNYLHFLFAETSAHGDFVDGKAAMAMTRKEIPPDEVPTRTTVTAAVRGLHVGKRFVAERAQVGLVSNSPAIGSKQPSIRLEGNAIEGVVVDGHNLKITLDEELFSRYDTMEKLQAAQGLAPEQTNMFYSPAGAGRDRLYVSGGMAYATIVRSMDWVNGRPEDLEDLGVNAFYLPGFGAVYFGELFISEFSRRLTMIRFQLGSDAGGDVAVAEGETNGSHWPE
ncbi:MAG: hypothetical protein M3Z09_13575 [Acidobacteriota bacterium]|nr:hypothetical protein [Acidobacteriota bacterium]